MKTNHDLDTSPVSSQQGRSWLVQSNADLLNSKPTVCVSHRRVPASNSAASARESHPIQHSYSAQVSGASSAAALMSQAMHTPPLVSAQATATRPSPGSESGSRTGANRVQIVSVNVPNVATVNGVAAHLPQEEHRFSEPANVRADPKTIAKTLADASSRRLESLSRTHGVVVVGKAAEPISEPCSEPPSEYQSTGFQVGASEAERDQKLHQNALDEWTPEVTDSASPESCLENAATDPAAEPGVSPLSVEATDTESHTSSATIEEAIPMSGKVESPAPSPPPEALTNSPAKSPSDSEQEVEGVLNSIRARTTPGQPTLLLFVGTEENRHIDSTTASVSSLLSKRRLGNVLLIDGNSCSRRLSIAGGTNDCEGLSDVIIHEQNWRPLIQQGAATGVDFLPYGKARLVGMRFQQALRHLAAELKSQYDYICVSAGTGGSMDARLWSDVSDGCYLLVSQKNSNQTISQSAVAELQADGARLLGCVVTDAEG